MDNLMKNIAQLHTTEMGAERIKKNLQIETGDIVQWCKTRILDKDAKIERRGKNWYITAGDCKLTVNARSYTIITAHRMKGPSPAQKANSAAPATQNELRGSGEPF